MNGTAVPDLSMSKLKFYYYYYYYYYYVDSDCRKGVSDESHLSRVPRPTVVTTMLMRLAPLVAPLQVLAVCRICIICAVITVGQYLRECVKCVHTPFNRGIRLGSACFKRICVYNIQNCDTLERSA